LIAQPLRVLHCPDVVGGHPPQLARAERALGVQSWAVTFHPSPYAYAVDETIFAPDDRAATRERKRLELLWRAVAHFDVVHFNFGSSLFVWPGARPSSLKPFLLWMYQSALYMRDLPILKLAGKRVFVTYQGDDARQGDFSRANFPIHFSHEVGPEYYPPGSDEIKRRAISTFDRYADGIYALVPDLLHVLPRRAKFLPYANVDVDEWRPASPPSTQGPLRVVHAPTSRGAKGTQHLIEAVVHLKRRGVPIQLVLVERVTREAARKAYEQADVVVDQLLGRWYAGVGVEAMALGKPVVAYINEVDLALVPRAMQEDLPVINAHPGTIGRVLAELATEKRISLQQEGARARAYVEKWHRPEAVAAQVIADYRAALERR
jgi:glycosyltransferase involved in cell wall biosynthesis